MYPPYRRGVACASLAVCSSKEKHVLQLGTARCERVMLTADRPAGTGNARVLVIDDEPSSLHLLEKLLRRAGYPQVRTTSSGDDALRLCNSFKPDLLILDIHMKDVDGFEVLQRLRSDLGGQELLPVLVITGDDDPAVRQRAESLGADDFVLKPFAIDQVTERIEALLHMRSQWAALDTLRQELRRCLEREALPDVYALQTVAAACRAENVAAGHPERVGVLSGALAAGLGMNPALVWAIQLAAPLHDVGKLALCTRVLEKPGPLTRTERAMTQRHTLLGAAALSVAKSPMLRLAAEIAAAHHERWDGRGYPRRLTGAEIPLAARIVAVADVFDALTHERSYKPAWTVVEALDELVAESGRQFDPAVVATLLRLAAARPSLLQPFGSATGQSQAELDTAVAARSHLERLGLVEDVVGRASVA